MLEGAAWDAARPPVLAALELEDEPAGHLAELAFALEGAYTRVLDGLGGNTAVQFVGGKLRVDKLGPAPEPPLMGEFRDLISGMLPQVDFPELLLDVFDRAQPAAEFTRISGADTSMEDFAVSLCGLLVADRPDLLVALSYVREGDMLAVQEVDRLGRNLLEGLIVLNDLFQQGVGVKVLEGIAAGEHTERSFLLDRHRRGESIRIIAAGVKVSIGVVHQTITEARAATDHGRDPHGNGQPRQEPPTWAR